MSDTTPMVAQAFQDKVKERLRATIAELIPEDKWNELVAAAIKSFIEGGRDRYNSPTPPELAEIVRVEMRSQATERVRAIFADPDLRLRAGLSAFEATIVDELARQSQARALEIAQAAFAGMLAGHASYHQQAMSFAMHQLEQNIRNAPR